MSERRFRLTMLGCYLVAAISSTILYALKSKKEDLCLAIISLVIVTVLTATIDKDANGHS